MNDSKKKTTDRKPLSDDVYSAFFFAATADARNLAKSPKWSTIFLGERDLSYLSRWSPADQRPENRDESTRTSQLPLPWHEYDPKQHMAGTPNRKK